MLKIALTGGIGAGKSTVAKMFAQLGAHTIDADVLAREAVQPGTPALQQIAAEFGREVLTAHGELNRKALAAQVFNDYAAKKRLEQIVHPQVQQLFEHQVTALLARDANAIIIYEIPLLLESGKTGDFNGIIAVSANLEVRAQRLVKLRNFTHDEAMQRIAAQVSDTAREAAANWVIKTDTDFETVKEQVRQVWQEIQQLR